MPSRLELLSRDQLEEFDVDPAGLFHDCRWQSRDGRILTAGVSGFIELIFVAGLAIVLAHILLAQINELSSLKAALSQKRSSSAVP